MKIYSIVSLATVGFMAYIGYSEWPQHHNPTPAAYTNTFQTTPMPRPDMLVIDQSELECLSLNIYHEARGESEEGQIAVAQVTMNRVRDDYFPNTICDVVWQSNQFSWTSDGRSDVPNEIDAYERAERIAEAVIRGHLYDPTDGALFYHATYIDYPHWTIHMTVADRIGVHIFYHWDGSWG